MNLHLLPSSESKSGWGPGCVIYYLEHWLIALQVAVEPPVRREQNVQSLVPVEARSTESPLQLISGCVCLGQGFCRSKTLSK